MRTSMQQSDNSESAWVAMTDLFLILMIVFLGIAVHATMAGSAANSQYIALLTQMQAVTAQSTEASDQITRLREDLRKAQDEVAKFKAAQESLTADGKPISIEALERKVSDQRDRADTAEREYARLQRELATIRELLKTTDAELETTRKFLSDARTEKAAMQSKLTEALRRVAEVELQLANAHGAEASFRQEILGIQGELGRVVFVFDRSESMEKGRRWEDASSTMRLWLNLLPVKQAAVVMFSNDADPFPNPPVLWEMTSGNKKKLMDAISNLRPEGRTNTLAALRVAYSYAALDAIVLFTDGEPDDPAATRNYVVEMKRRFPKTRIHTVGIGDYFSDRKFSDFLLGVARDSGGAFIGR